MKHQYIPQGVCSRMIELDVENGIIKSVKFTGGCSGNTQGVAALAVGRNVSEVIESLEGLKCGSKDTSCPAQLAEALKQCL